MTKARNVRFGLIYTAIDHDREESANPERQKYEPHWNETLEHMAWAESIGFDSIWLTEHHFGGFTPSPTVFAAAVAARTKRVRISSCVMLAPLYHPVRLAEESAMLSVISNGRYDVGIGVGYNPVDFERFGVELKNRPSLMEETIEILRLAWTGEPFSFNGKRYRFNEISVVPVPANAPRIWVGGFVPAAIERAARMGDGFISAYNTDIPVYLKAVANLGKAGIVCSGNQAIIAEDKEKTWAEIGKYAVRYCNIHVRGGLHGDIPEFVHPQQVLDEKLYTIWDGATAVFEITQFLLDNPMVEDFSFMVSAGPGEPLAKTYERLQFTAEKVLPQIRANLAAAG